MLHRSHFSPLRKARPLYVGPVLELLVALAVALAVPAVLTTNCVAGGMG